MVTINDLRSKYGEYPLESIMVISKLLKVDKSYIYTYGDKVVEDEVKDNYIDIMENIKSGYPIQYILGEREFMGLDFYLEEGVLIPRPDTEILVEYIIDYAKKRYGDENIKILDLGIGSGAISLSVAHYLKNTIVYGVDISEMAIKVANINKDRFKLSNVEFYKGDLFQALTGLSLEGEFHIIASNPPYIATKEIQNLDIKVRGFEPRLALEGGLDGLDFYRKITPMSKKYLQNQGLLIYEIGYDQGEKVKDILTLEGFKEVKILKDLQGLDRVVLGLKNG